MVKYAIRILTESTKKSISYNFPNLTSFTDLLNLNLSMSSSILHHLFKHIHDISDSRRKSGSSMCYLAKLIPMTALNQCPMQYTNELKTESSHNNYKDMHDVSNAAKCSI